MGVPGWHGAGGGKGGAGGGGGGAVGGGPGGEKATAGASTAAAVRKYRKGSCGSRHYCGSGEIQRKLLRERALLRQ